MGPVAATVSAATRALTGRRALVIEDASDLAAELNELLCGQGVEVLNVHSVEQVNSGLIDFNPQACIVDLNLRGGRGAEMLRLVGKLFPMAGTILLADEVNASYVTDALADRQQLTECVSKPIEPKRLLGAVTRCVAAYDAAHARDRAAREIAHLYGKLGQATQTANSVLANLSHELRTPLNAIIGFSEMLSYDKPIATERLREYAGGIHQSGLHMLGVIETVLTFAALESGLQAIEPALLDVSALLERQLLAMHPAALAAGVVLTRRIPARLPNLLGDQQLITRCVHALADNAIEFAQRRGKRVGIVARATDLGGLSIQVADNGPGIDDGAISQIQQPFTVGEDIHTRQHGGLGLGLAIARKVMELHEGELKLRSRPGVGTVVTLLFPKTRCMR
jgi:signal transduction histidine kinase